MCGHTGYGFGLTMLQVKAMGLPMHKLRTVAKYDALIKTCQYFILYLVFVFIIQSIFINTDPGASDGASGTTYVTINGKLRSRV